jgi:hypothetical protein
VMAIIDVNGARAYPLRLANAKSARYHPRARDSASDDPGRIRSLNTKLAGRSSLLKSLHRLEIEDE